MPTLLMSAAAGSMAAGSASLAAAGTGATMLSMASTIFSGMQQRNDLNSMASDTRMQAMEDKLRSTQRQTEMKRNLLQALGENDVAFAAAGIDLSQGAAAANRDRMTQRTVEELNIDRREADFRQAMFRQRAQTYRRRAGQAMGGAMIRALGQGFEAGMTGARIGG